MDDYISIDIKILVMVVSLLVIFGCNTPQSVSISSLEVGSKIEMPSAVSINDSILETDSWKGSPHNYADNGYYEYRYRNDDYVLWLTSKQTNGKSKLLRIEASRLDQDNKSDIIFEDLYLGMNYQSAVKKLQDLSNDFDVDSTSSVQKISRYELEFTNYGIYEIDDQIIQIFSEPDSDEVEAIYKADYDFACKIAEKVPNKELKVCE